MRSEMSDKPCDTGSSISVLAKEFPTVDFSEVGSLWPSKAGPFAYDREAVLQRGVEARLWLRRRPEKIIAVVSHSAFLRTSVASSRFANADYRIFEFADDSEDSPRLVQWEISEVRGGAMGRSAKGLMGIESGDFKPEGKHEPQNTTADTEKGR